MKKEINVAVNLIAFLLVSFSIAYYTSVIYDIIKLWRKGYDLPLIFVDKSTCYAVVLVICIICFLLYFNGGVIYRRFLSFVMLSFSVFWAALYLTNVISLL